MLDSYAENRFVTFSTDLFQHQSVSNTFFDSNLLWYIKKNFGFSNLLINIYDESGDYLASVLPDQHGDDSPFRAYLDKQYRLDYHRDPCSSFINTFCHRTKQQGTCDFRLFLSTDIIPSTSYENSEYIHSLRNFGYQHSLAIPFSENGCYHLTFYKGLGEGNFSDRELHVIRNIYQILFHAYSAHEDVQAQKAALQHYRPAAGESSGTGILLLDRSFRVLYCDDTAKQNLSDMYRCPPIAHLEHSHLSFLNLLFPQGASHEKARRKSFQEYDFTLLPFAKENPPYTPKAYYCLKITKRERAGTYEETPRPSFDCLTQRELDIVRLLAEGLSYEQTAKQLFISVNTVRNHIQNMFKKLGIHNQRQLLKLYAEQE